MNGMGTGRALLLGAVIAAGLAVVVPAGSRGDLSPVPLTCPAAYTGDEHVPSGWTGLLGRTGDPDLPRVHGPSGFDPHDTLAPRRTPTRVLVCSYAAGPNSDITPAPNPLTSTWEVQDGLAQVATDLSSVHAEDAEGCTDAGGDVTRQLVGLEYDETAVWVSVTDEPNGCIPASNGSFRGRGGIGHLVAEAVDQQAWVQPTHGRRRVCGETIADGRDEGRTALVPGTPSRVAICRSDDEAAGTFGVQSGLRAQLLTELATLDTRPASGEVPDCGEGSRQYDLVLRYGRGADVVIRASIGCDRDEVGNGDLVATATPELAALLETATTHP